MILKDFYQNSTGHTWQKFLIFAVFVAINFPYFGQACCSTASSAAPVPAGCCPPLTQTITNNTQFADGVFTFTYDSNVCRTQVIATCSTPNPNIQLNAAIVANTNNFLAVGAQTVSFPGVCDANNNWNMGNPPLVIATLECLLTNPNQG